MPKSAWNDWVRSTIRKMSISMKPGLLYFPPSTGLSVSNLDFSYPGAIARNVLEEINLTLKKDTVTAVVGVSGSGKTTLVKLLLGFYPPANGEIRVGDMNIQMMSPDLWRSQCGVVMQDGYIFLRYHCQKHCTWENQEIKHGSVALCSPDGMYR